MTDGEGEQTRIASASWGDRPRGYRAWERATVVGHGEAHWRWAADELLRWRVKTRSGFTVVPGTPVQAGEEPVITAHPFGLAIPEPVRVIAVLRSPSRVGFAYRTRPGHPVTGEEAFILSRVGDDVVLTIRSLTQPGDTLLWRMLFPLLLVAQAVVRRRYARALKGTGRSER